MDRRGFLLTSLAGALAAPLAAEAQQAGQMWRIGYLGFAPTQNDEAFRQGLRELGYIEGTNVALEYRWATPDVARYPTLAAELVALGVDVIVAAPTAILPAKATTTTIPIVAPLILEAVETGIAKSLARPGGNVTGLAWEEGTELVTKKLELFKQMVPTTSRMAAVWDPSLPGLSRYWQPAHAAAATLGIALSSVQYARTEDFDRLRDRIFTDRPEGVFFWTSTLFDISSRREAVCDFAVKKRVPTLGANRYWTEAGCLMSYSADPRERYRRAAVYVDKILKGAKPGSLPIEQPTKYELVINAKTAKALGLTIPPSLLLRADQALE